MDTQALLTDLTPEQEENVNGGWVLGAIILLAGLGVGIALWTAWGKSLGYWR